MPQPAAGSYDQALQALVHAQRGAYGDLSYMPVFRASALFYVIADEHINTRIAFLNYWREKNDNPDVGVLVTVRDERGTKRARSYVKLDGMTYDFDLKAMLGDGASPFRGSMELEAFSSQDLKFQFPGLSVFYESARGVSYVHSNQRVYNDAEDRSRGVHLNPWQGGFEIDARRHDPFIFIVNGPTAFAGGPVPLKVLNSAGDSLLRTLDLAALPPYGALDIRLGAIDGVTEFLGEGVGTCQIDLPLQDVHLRLAAGNALRGNTWLSVTHSYFDATGHRDYFETSQMAPGVYPAFVPFHLVDGLDVDLVLYPIYAPCELVLSLQGFRDGQLSFETGLGSWRTPEGGLRRLPVRQLLRDRGLREDPGLYVLQIQGAEGRVPQRITYGLNFHVGSRLGTNISASAYLAKSWGVGRRSWKWGPVVAQPGGRNLIMVSVFSKDKAVTLEGDASVVLYGASGLVAQTTVEFSGNCARTIEAEDLLHEAGYRPAAGEILWYVVKSEQTSLDVNHVCISAEGYVGGDHSF